MFADVYLLRQQGEKVAAPVGIRGKLLVQRGFVTGGAEGRRLSMTASIHIRWPQPFPGHAEANLYDATLTRLDERGFVLVGLEVVRDGFGANTYRQAWACVPLAPGG